MKTFFMTLTAAALMPLSYGATVLTLNADDLQQAAGTYTLSEGIGSGYGNISVTMALDAQAFQNAILAGNITTNLFTANNMIGLGINYVSNPSTAGIYGSWQGGAFSRTITPINESTVNLNTGLKELFSDTSYVSAAITYQITSDGTYTYLTLLDSVGTATTISGQEFVLKSSTFGSLSSFTYGTDYVKYLVVDNTTLTAADSVSANLAAISASVPESATASLGLLGLTVLMLRRRRA